MISFIQMTCTVYIVSLAISTSYWCLAHIKEVILIVLPENKIFNTVKGRGRMAVGYPTDKFVWTYYLEFEDGRFYALVDNAWVYRDSTTIRSEEINAYLNSDGEVTGVFIMGPKVLNKLHDNFVKINKDVLLSIVVGVLICLFIT